ncbi:transmembrane protein 177 isoform X2 [Oratosquilla oratoria]
MSWFTSSAGLRTARVMAISGGIGSFCVFYLPNTFLLDKYKEITQLYRNGVPVAVPLNIKGLANKVFEDMKMTEVEKKLVKLYSGYGFDMFRGGSTQTKHGAIVGVPANFKYSTIEDFETSGIMLNKDCIPWNSAGGLALKKSVILSEEAKKFALAREFHHIKTAEPYIIGFASSLTFLACYSFTSGLNRKLKLYSRPRSLRLCLYLLTCSFFGTFWCFMKDFTTCVYEYEADSVIGDLGSEYVRGGLEFYEKIIQRNCSLRLLLGKDGESIYTAYGNDEVFLRTRHVPFTVRRDYFRQRNAELDEQTKENENNETISEETKENQKIGETNEKSKENQNNEKIIEESPENQNSEEISGPLGNQDSSKSPE